MAGEQQGEQQGEPQGGESQQDFGLGFAGDGKELAPGATADNMSWKDNSKLFEGMNEGRDRSGGQYS